MRPKPLTEEQSAKLKEQFKAHFRRHGYDAPLPNRLLKAKYKHPVEWAEAIREWEDWE